MTVLIAGGSGILGTRDMNFDASETARRYPAVERTSLAEMVRRDDGEGSGGWRNSPFARRIAAMVQYPSRPERAVGT